MVVTAKGYNNFFMFLTAVFTLILGVYAESYAHQNHSRRKIIWEDFDSRHTRSKRADSGALGKCAEEELTYCQFNFTLQFNSTLKTTKAEVALCKSSFPTCPKVLNRTKFLHRCDFIFGCNPGNRGPNQCKAFGAYCFDKIDQYGEKEYFGCCNGKIVTPSGKKIEVPGGCNHVTNLCEPKFPLNFPCGDYSQDYLACYDYFGDDNVCSYPTELLNNPVDNKFRVTSSVKKIKVNGVEVVEPKRCLKKISQPCTETKPYKTFCGSRLPVQLDNYPYCACPRPDMKFGYDCDMYDACSECGLDGVPCTKQTYRCCANFECSKSFRCVPK